MEVSVLIHPMDKLVFDEFDLSKALELKNATHALFIHKPCINIVA